MASAAAAASASVTVTEEETTAKRQRSDASEGNEVPPLDDLLVALDIASRDETQAALASPQPTAVAAAALAAPAQPVARVTAGDPGRRLRTPSWPYSSVHGLTA